MRPLAMYSGMKLQFEGTVANFGTNKYNNEETILMVDIKGLDFEDFIIPHTWCQSNSKFSSYLVRKGQIVKFEATVRPYRKGNRGQTLDYGLSNPKFIDIVGMNRDYSAIEQIRPTKNRINIHDTAMSRSNLPTIGKKRKNYKNKR